MDPTYTTPESKTSNVVPLPKELVVSEPIPPSPKKQSKKRPLPEFNAEYQLAIADNPNEAKRYQYLIVEPLDKHQAVEHRIDQLRIKSTEARRRFDKAYHEYKQTTEEFHDLFKEQIQLVAPDSYFSKYVYLLNDDSIPTSFANMDETLNILKKEHQRTICESYQITLDTMNKPNVIQEHPLIFSRKDLDKPDNSVESLVYAKDYDRLVQLFGQQAAITMIDKLVTTPGWNMNEFSNKLGFLLE